MNSSTLKKATKYLNNNTIKLLMNNFIKHQSSTMSQGHVITEINDKSGFATVTFNRPPANSFNLEFLQDFLKTLDELDRNKCRGMILTSSSPTTFSSGLDLKEFYNPDEKRLKELIATYVNCCIRLYSTFYPTVAAINGHAIAGGSFMAINCEYRVMLPNFRIGMNETQLGMTISEGAIWIMTTLLNPRNAENALTLGKIFTTEDAKKIGLIDEIANDKEDAIAKSQAFLESYKKVPIETRGATKQIFRKKGIDLMTNNRDKDVDVFVKHVLDPKCQKMIEMFLNPKNN
ncbi:hypothetical protein PVAND_015577 [Polypedilum vanderplanki]|uniref:Enoyl-CoA hydratase/isomerase n=1 Tax=Polypedilum vanderplanki TaxID=319348 RepID=A0A9J6BCK9_POLVA|nr:hypothetical protein PVAND_015577 [Polypedilum vanderplanki]